MNEPNFLYINTVSDECIPIEINGNADRDALLDLTTNQNHKDLIYAWLIQHTKGTDDEQDLPDQDQIVSLDVELWDDGTEALSGGNETTEIWATAR